MGWLAFLILVVGNGIVFFIGYTVGWMREATLSRKTIDEVRKLAKTRMGEIQSLEESLAVSEDRLRDADSNYDILEKRLKSAEEFRDGVLALSRGEARENLIQLRDKTLKGIQK